ncbi:hypothetical protein [Paraburkholderia pallida]|uniref:Uncharacterized protein n=1 Tax=Paraburkholderia pallida TaxID=2547399 RepID=A0A4P7D081_9BURK|nr:hypothetical protein [Paraburkholderia pallida]QBR00497.1 hypothetical protein E1956_26040 [Paraburkholderia pallida]
MPHRPPLTAARLAQIWNEHPEPIVLELLWEIHRLRSTILRANQVRRFMGPDGTYNVPGPVWECFNRELDVEPCLTDEPTPRQQAVIDGSGKRSRED